MQATRIYLVRHGQVGILGDEALPTLELVPKNQRFYDYRAKYESDRTEYHCPGTADAAEEARYADLALAAADLGRRDAHLGARLTAAPDLDLGAGLIRRAATETRVLVSDCHAPREPAVAVLPAPAEVLAAHIGRDFFNALPEPGAFPQKLARTGVEPSSCSTFCACG